MQPHDDVSPLGPDESQSPRVGPEALLRAAEILVRARLRRSAEQIGGLESPDQTHASDQSMPKDRAADEP